ncbi:hypothetical protein C8R45DRAFT_1178333 [Mycena sanguinolenta]|nr:hypothetical protein C8R45DRAFT_1178333 [Mycena sanguinolenta]
MQRRYTTPTRLRSRVPIPQLDIGSVGPGEQAIVQNDPNHAGDVAQQDDAPQRVQSAAGANGTVPPGSASGTAILGESTGANSTAGLGATEALESSSAQFASATVFSSVTSSLTASAGVASSSIAPLSSSPSSSLPSASISSVSLSSTSLSSLSSVSSASSRATSSESIPPVSSSSTPPSAPSSSTSPSPSASTSSAASISHGAPFYATIALGTLILIACLAAIVACLIRIRTRRREAAAISTIAWDPAVLDGANAKEATAPDLSLVGDRDVGEPKRSESFLGSGSTHTDSYQYQPPFDTTYQAPMANPFVETAYYSPHQVPPLVDSAAYPLPPPRPALTTTIPGSMPSTGPYPTARPLPAHLADRDPHRITHSRSPSARMSVGGGAGGSGSGSGWRTAASSRRGSVRSQLPSATTLCVTNGDTSRASTALGTYAEDAVHDPQAQALSLPRQQEQEEEYGTPREREARPRFMSLTDGRGLDVPWRQRRQSESFAARAGGTPGWAKLEEHGGAGADVDGDGEHGRGAGEGEGWTQTLRASVLSAFHAVTGGAGVASPLPSRDGDDGLTRAPTMSRARARREEGWARFSARQGGGDLERGQSVSSRDSVLHVPNAEYYYPHHADHHQQQYHHHEHHLQPPLAALQHSALSMGTDISMGTTMTGETVRTENSRAPLIVARPRPAALVSRASSVYSTASAVLSTAFGYRS